MIIGVPREIKDSEYRVGLVPSGAHQLTEDGHQVVIESGAGAGSVSGTRSIRKRTPPSSQMRAKSIRSVTWW